MATKTKIRTTVELNVGDKERLQEIAAALGFVQRTGPDKGKGSTSALMQAIAQSRLSIRPTD